MSAAPRAAARLRAAWCLYDFANSAFATTILAVLFNAYYATELAAGRAILGLRIPGPTLYTFLLSGSLLVVAAGAPWLGVRADASWRVDRWLTGWALVGILATAGLTLARGRLGASSLLFFLAVVGFSWSSIVYNALLPRIAPRARIGRLSGWGWGLGYLGGGLVLVLELALLRGVHLPTIGRLKLAVPETFLLSAGWWLVWGLPLFAGARRLPAPASRPRARTLRGLWRNVRGSPQLLRLLVANLLYNDGLQTVVAMASVFAAEILGWDAQRRILFFLLLQGAALVGSPVLGRAADRWGDKPVLLGCLAAWVLVVLGTWRLGWTGRAASEFWALGLLGGFVLGPTQALTRSLLARAVPEERSAAAFSLLGISNRFAAVLGPATYGITAWATGSLRAAALSTAVFFVSGGLLLWRLRVGAMQSELEAWTGSGPGGRG
jgi:UMF1 family MFS transporter